MTSYEPDPNDPSQTMTVRVSFEADGVYVSLNDLARYFASPGFDAAGEMTGLEFSQLLLDIEGFYYNEQKEEDGKRS